MNYCLKNGFEELPEKESGSFTHKRQSLLFKRQNVFLRCSVSELGHRFTDI